MIVLLPLVIFGLLLHLQLPAVTPAGLIPMQAMAVQGRAWEAASASQPLVLRSLQEASPYFPKADQDRLSREVDFSRQVVLLFAWRGSGQDRLEAVQQEKTVAFTLSRGLTRDMREHQAIFVLTSGMTWSVR